MTIASPGERSMSGWNELYRENILDHYKNPRNHGPLEHPDITFEDANPLCGDKLRMDFRIADGKIAERWAGWKPGRAPVR